MQWTLFLDILGYGQEQKKIDNQEKANDFIQFMSINKELIKVQDQMNKQFFSDKDINLYEYYDFKAVFISDSFVLSAIPKVQTQEFLDNDYYDLSAFTLIELTYQIFIFIENILKEKGLIVRGGISNKFADIDDVNSLAVGEGLIEAYELESKFAKVPRILISKEISNNKKLMLSLKKHSKVYGNILSKDTDRDDFYYLNYLSFMLELLNKSEKQRVKVQNEIEERYGINENIIQDFQELLKDKDSSDFISRLDTFNNSITAEQQSKLNQLLKEKDRNSLFIQYKQIIQDIQSTKYVTIDTLKKLQETIQSELKVNKDKPTTYEKYVWLREYLNKTIQNFQNIEYLDFIQKYKLQ